jgi:diacylglycerol kinase family enzyme
MDKPEQDLTSRPVASIKRVEAVVNSASGGVGQESAAALKLILDRFELESRVWTPDPGRIDEALLAAVKAKPDLIVVLAGDGTASRAADLCGPDGPLLAPLPGGTMNMLPHALYGERSWREALTDCLERGRARPVSCGEVGGHRFYCVAILGSPAFWQPAREAARHGDLRQAWEQAVVAFRRAFSTRLRFQVEGGPRRKAMALSLICPLVSRVFSEEDALEAAGLDLHDVIEVFRLGLHNLMGDWRDDPGVVTEPCVAGRAWTRRRIPCVIDGEMRWLPRSVNIRFVPKAFRALAPPLDAQKEIAP